MKDPRADGRRGRAPMMPMSEFPSATVGMTHRPKFSLATLYDESRACPAGHLCGKRLQTTQKAQRLPTIFDWRRHAGSLSRRGDASRKGS